VREEQLHDPGPVMDVAQGNMTEAQDILYLLSRAGHTTWSQRGRHQAANHTGGSSACLQKGVDNQSLQAIKLEVIVPALFQIVDRLEARAKAEGATQ
jgi:hypothetical protein